MSEMENSPPVAKDPPRHWLKRGTRIIMGKLLALFVIGTASAFANSVLNLLDPHIFAIRGPLG
ncbi:hypothetical protein RISK_000476 [Rhodopirellula islandica]|uniref:Uncharacterized protein n=1 Tax=Rhodopirellula islandica TaxID=595434 RepID=A0A0J1BLS3_RHOIS|nr:hypothetical protein RISK_000476 [Rhodopirellula islandica]